MKKAPARVRTGAFLGLGFSTREPGANPSSLHTLTPSLSQRERGGGSEGTQLQPLVVPQLLHL